MMVQRLMHVTPRCRLLDTAVRKRWVQQLSSFSTTASDTKDAVSEGDAGPRSDTSTTTSTTTAWIPPNRPLSGDMGQSRSIMNVDQENEDQTPDNDDDGVVDWLQTRRSKLKGALKSSEELSQLEVVPNTLLSLDEIMSCLKGLGGQDIVVLNHTKELMGGGIMVLATCSSPAHITTIAQIIVANLKKRKLAKLGVVGAMYGSEGGSPQEETWRVVDCSNYILHLLTESTRQHLELEKLWSDEDSLRQVNIENDDELEDYVAANPIPNGYYNGLGEHEEWTTESLTKRLQIQRRSSLNEPLKRNNRKQKRKKPRRR